MLLSYALIARPALCQRQKRRANLQFDPAPKLAVEREAEHVLIKVLLRLDVLPKENRVVQVANRLQHGV